MEDQPKVVQAGKICLNPDCEKHQVVGGDNLVGYGRGKQGGQRIKCTACNKVFSERKGTLFYRKRTGEGEILDCLTMVSQGSRIAAVGQTKGKKPETIGKWVKEAGVHAGGIENALLAGYKVGASEVDGLWSYVKNKGKKK